MHGGSGLNFGLIELLRNSRPEEKFLELVHRIDKETSGIILIAKKRKALVEIHQQMRKRSIHKKYQVIVNGRWEKKQLIVDNDGSNLQIVASLSDKTPLVSLGKRNRGKVFLFHVTANNDWSNLPISSLFAGMLQRIILLSEKYTK